MSDFVLLEHTPDRPYSSIEPLGGGNWAGFGRPGIGRLLFQGSLGFDYPVVMGVLLVMSLILALALPLRDGLEPNQDLLLADALVPGSRTGYGGG